MLLLALAYAGGYISQFIINYQVWTSSGGTPGNGTSPEFPSAAVPEDPFGDVPEDLAALFPPEEGCTIVMTDKKSIMS